MADPQDPSERHAQPYERTIRANSLIAVLVAIVGLTFVVDYSAARHNRAVKLDERVGKALVADPESSTQTWQLTPTGAVWRIVDRTGEQKNVGRIRHYLRERNKAFHRGDYSDPSFNGLPVDGRSELQTFAAKLELIYRSEKAGGTLTWRPEDPTLVPALHAWANAVIKAGPAKTIP